MGKRLTIQEMKEIAKVRGGKCLSKVYVDAKTHLTWQCKEGHIWDARPYNIKTGKWCPVCGYKNAGLHFKKSLKDARAIAKERDGKCLSKEYINSRTNLLWRCKAGHEFERTLEAVQNGRWCSKCNGGYRKEEACRLVFEAIFKKKFTKTRKLKWLINSKGNKMELDGYNEELSLAFEYHGRQHFMYVGHFSKNKKGFKQRVNDDKLKQKHCKKNGVKLITIPYSVDLSELQKFIKKELKKNNIKFKNKLYSLNFGEVYNPENLKKMKEIAKDRDGRCLSKEYIGSAKKLSWKCNKCKHIWEATPNKIQQGSWCPKCARQELIDNQTLTIQDAQKSAESKNGECLSKRYVDSTKKMKWKCEYGHIWQTPYAYIRAGNWCPKCAGKGKGLNDLKKLAKDKNGKCLSTKYTRMDHKYNWKCSKGHEWSAVASAIQAGQWCPTCGDESRRIKSRKYTVKDLQDTAKSRNGKCLAKEYISRKVKVEWQCEKKHKWFADYEHILRSQWCPICAKQKRKKS